MEDNVNGFFLIYQDRNDIEGLMDFYADDIVFKDMINGDKLHGKTELKEFLDWGNPQFKNLENRNLVIRETIIGEGKAAVTGYFHKFQWGENTYGPMHFTTLFTFNKEGKISKQVDWINYPSNLIDYNRRKDSNEWIKQLKGPFSKRLGSLE